MNSYQKTIFRGVPLKFRDYPLTVSALRKNELTFLENFFSETFGADLLNEYKQRLNISSPIPLFLDASPTCAWAWFLSLIRIVIEIQNKPQLLKPLQHATVITVFENLTKVPTENLPECIYQSACTVFGPCNGFDYLTKQAFSNTEVSSMVYGFEYYQHLNYDVRGTLDYNPFPTMVMDWTEDIAIANHFSSSDGESGIILSIDYDKYKRLLYDEWYPLIMDAGLAATLPGFTPYFDYHSVFSKRNINMQNQKGLVLFWPWSYTIAELKENELGKKLGFREIMLF